MTFESWNSVPTLASAYRTFRTTGYRPADALARARAVVSDYRAACMDHEDAAMLRDHAQTDSEFASATRLLDDARRRLQSTRFTACAPAPERRVIHRHGDVIRTRDSKGRRRTFLVVHARDDHMAAPWNEHDGHGPVYRDPGALDDGHRTLPGGCTHGHGSSAGNALGNRWSLGPPREAKSGEDHTASRTCSTEMIQDETTRHNILRQARRCAIRKLSGVRSDCSGGSSQGPGGIKGPPRPYQSPGCVDARKTRLAPEQHVPRSAK